LIWRVEIKWSWMKKMMQARFNEMLVDHRRKYVYLLDVGCESKIAGLSTCTGVGELGRRCKE